LRLESAEIFGREDERPRGGDGVNGVVGFAVRPNRKERKEKPACREEPAEKRQQSLYIQKSRKNANYDS
jgi:hypothetical protein